MIMLTRLQPGRLGRQLTIEWTEKAGRPTPEYPVSTVYRL